MATVTTDRPVNLYQLGLELGGSPAWRMVDDGETRTVSTDSVTQEALEAALAAHVADPSVRLPDEPPEPEPDPPPAPDLEPFAAQAEKATSIAALRKVVAEALRALDTAQTS